MPSMKVLSFIIFSISMFNAYGQEEFFISENQSDFLYGKIYNEVETYSKNRKIDCNGQLKSNEALIIKQSCTSYLIKPLKDSGIITLNYIAENGQQDSFFYVVYPLPTPELYVYPKRNHYGRPNSYLIDSITAVIPLSNRRILNGTIDSFSISVVHKGKKIKKMICSGNRLSELQKAEFKKVISFLTTGDEILLEKIVVTVEQTKKIIKSHSIRVY